MFFASSARPGRGRRGGEVDIAPIEPMQPFPTTASRPTSSTGDWSLKNLAPLSLLTAFAFFVMGYHPGLEDDAFYLAAIKKNLNPALFPHDSEFFTLQFQATIFDKLIAFSVRLSHLPLAWAVLFWQLAAIFLVLHGCWRISRRCFPKARPMGGRQLGRRPAHPPRFRHRHQSRRSTSSSAHACHRRDFGRHRCHARFPERRPPEQRSAAQRSPEQRPPALACRLSAGPRLFHSRHHGRLGNLLLHISALTLLHFAAPRHKLPSRHCRSPPRFCSPLGLDFRALQRRLAQSRGDAQFLLHLPLAMVRMARHLRSPVFFFIVPTASSAVTLRTLPPMALLCARSLPSATSESSRPSSGSRSCFPRVSNACARSSPCATCTCST